MKNTDAELIQRVLDGDDTAFSDLVNKYQKSVHALAWRKVQDFHIAEDITQETFLRAYRRLSSLKEPHSFASWLYVIATNQCKTWLSKKRLMHHSLDATNNSGWEKATYSSYVRAENERTSVEAQREVVKKLLAKLQESDRTVITLYYLGGMTYEEISKFLGVSVSAIKNRLYRARQHLKKEETMIREALEHFKLSPNLTDNIMQEVSRLKPTPSTSKPIVPWAVATASAILFVLMLGLGSQNLIRFQQPYTLDAQAETAIELVDAPIVLNIDSEPDVRNQLGKSSALGQNEYDGQKPHEVLLAAAQADGEDSSVPKQQWIHAKPIKGSYAGSFLATPDGDLYADVHGNFFKLPANEQKWQHIFGIWTLNTRWDGEVPLVKWKNSLYIIPSNELFISIDEGQTWDLIYTWTDQHTPIKLIATDFAFYAAFESGDIFRSKDTGKTWEKLNNGIKGHIGSLEKIQNTLFAGTDTGLYRLNDDRWEHIKFPVPTIGAVKSVAATEEKLYAFAELSWDVLDTSKVEEGQQRAWWIFRSTDLGDSWTDITPTNAWPVKGWPPYIKLVAAGETLLVMERDMVRSTNGGDTWMSPQLAGTIPNMDTWRSAVVVNTHTIYVSSRDGLHRSTDKGKSWEIARITPDERVIDNLIAIKKDNIGQNMLTTLYGNVGEEIVRTNDRGQSWKTIQIEIPMSDTYREAPPKITHIFNSGGVIYAKGGKDDGFSQQTRLYRVSTDGSKLVRIQGLPYFDNDALQRQLSQDYSIETLQDSSAGARQFFKQIVTNPQMQSTLIRLGFHGPFAVSGDTFYMEYNFKLFRCEPKDTEWYDTGVEETVELSREIAWKDLKLAVSGDTVYVGKRDGHLVVSYDKGNNWIDLTAALPFPVKTFNDIVVAGSTVYVATDEGIITSDGGRNWRVVTDPQDTNLIMEQLAVDRATLYGTTEKTGIYRLDSNVWEQVVSDAPNNITSLAVDGKTLYVGTQDRGMLHFNLAK